ncbi:MAG: serine hydrolase domain-containing protein [Candidatus Thorarchaeota archaeon]
MKKDKILVPLLLGLTILIPFIVYSITFPNILITTKIAATNNTNDFAKELEEKLPALLQKYQIYGGVAISLISDFDIIWVKEYGYANEKLGINITNDTYFQIASMSKTFCAWAVMNLYEDGLLDLDNPVDDYLTRWHLPETGFDNSEVTIRRILSHTAGLSLESFMGYETVDEVLSIEEALEDVKVIVEPGSTWMYSGGGYLVLQLLIEEVSNQSYTDYLTNEILSPLNLTHSRPDWSSDIVNSLATAYNSFGKELPHYRFTALAAGGHYSTILDLSEFVLANMDGSAGELPGRGVLNESTLEIMQTKVADVHPFMGGYGLGFQLKILQNGQKMVFHNGQNTGFIGTMNFIPETGEGIVILTSCDSAKSLIIELESQWQQMIQGTINNTLLYSKYIILIPAIITLIEVFIGINVWLLFALLKDRRSFSFRKNITRVIISSILGILIIISLILSYAPLQYRSGFAFVYWFVPEIHWTSLLLVVSLCYYIVVSLTVSKKITKSNISTVEM